MSRLSEMMYAPLGQVCDALNTGQDIDLDETQGALINAIQVIGRLEARITALENAPALPVNSLAMVLIAIRKILNLTQTELGNRLGVSFATINRWEAGSHHPQRAVRQAILTLATEAGIPVPSTLFPGQGATTAIPTVAECRQQPDRDPGAVSAHVNSLLAADSDGPCIDCNYPVEVWFAPNDVWNRVVPGRTGLLCLRCFVVRARQAGLDPSWKLEPERLGD
jgi:transcriptional regulator with XRE-family HTH domain